MKKKILIAVLVMLIGGVMIMTVPAGAATAARTAPARTAAPSEYSNDYMLDDGTPPGNSTGYAYDNGHGNQVITIDYLTDGLEDWDSQTQGCSICTGGWVELQSESGLCMQAYNSIVRLESCDGASFEVWEFVSLSAGGFALVNRHDDDALTASSFAAYATLSTAEGPPNGTNQWNWYYA